MEWGRAYGYFRDDPEWKGKVLMASLALLSAMFIPVLGQLIIGGWLAITFRRIVAGDDRTLPPIGFDNIGELLSAGFKPFLVQTIWMIPLAIFGIVAYFVAVFGAIMGGAASSAAHRAGEAGSQAASAGFGIGAMVCIGVFYLVFLVLSFVLGIFAYSAVTRVEVADDMKPGMQFKEVMAFAKISWGTILKVQLLTALINYFIVMIGMLLFCVGMFPASVITMLAGAHLRAQVYKQHLEKGGVAVPLKQEPGTTPPELRPQSF
ncbi:MAG: DUF4013 domain-containing protein [Deltaproteobacteria bacterium]|nr:DUF4013 domain-containing protein [Deltaproteobacteria bacterium]